jgi:hypothetical protein
MERRGVFTKRPKLAAPLACGISGFFLIFATPLCSAIFEQRSEMAVLDLEESIREEIHTIDPSIEYVYYNKGL